MHVVCIFEKVRLDSFLCCVLPTRVVRVLYSEPDVCVIRDVWNRFFNLV